MSNELTSDRLGVGLRLKAARELVNLSQSDVATRFGLNKATVSAWETGRGDPGIYRLRELAKLYKTSSESFLWESAPSNEAMQLQPNLTHLATASVKHCARSGWPSLKTAQTTKPWKKRCQ